MTNESKLYDLPAFTDDLILYRTAYGDLEKPVVCTALEYKLFDIISADGPMDMVSLIKKCSFPKRGGEAVINLVTALGYLKCIEGKYHLTETSETFFVNNTPFDWKYAMSVYNEPSKSFSDAWKNDLKGVIKAHNMIETWLETGDVPKESAEGFTKLMESFSLTRAIALSKKLDLNKTFGIKTILDVAGGSGSYCRALVANQPNLKAIVLELPAVCTVCDQYIKKSNLPEGAVLTYPCNMFKEPYPNCNDPKYGYQAIFMSSILHDWDDETNRFLCKKAYDALPVGGTIILHEGLFNEDGNGPLSTALLSIHMYSVARGRQFKFSELKEFLTEAGFVDIGSQLTIEPYYAVYGRKK